jgi:Ca2+-binding EF-hand superfamily protein
MICAFMISRSVVSWNIYRLSAASSSMAEINDKELRDSFSKIDTDRSGKISRAEIAAFFRRHGPLLAFPP